MWLRGIEMDFEMYKELTKVRVLMDENSKKAKQMVTNILQKFEKGLNLCSDTHCGSYSKCDKIHCLQFYEYTKDGIIKRD